MSQEYDAPGILDIGTVLKELISGNSALSWDAYFNPRTYLNNLPLLGDVKAPISEAQARYIAANSGAGSQLNLTPAQKQAASDEVVSYVNNYTADTSTVDSIQSALDSLVPSLPDFSLGGLGGVVVPIILVCAAAFAVFVVAKKL